MDEVYLDNAATTRPWPEVAEAMARVMGDGFGNASSLHSRGIKASRETAIAVETICNVTGSGPWKVIFTSGGCESDTMAVLGSVPRGKRDLVVTSTLEHSAVEGACKRVAEQGCRVREVTAGKRGVVDPEALVDAVDERAALVSLTHVANEIGTVQPVAEVARLVKEKSPSCRMHVDAVQALAQVTKLDYPPEIDMVSISAHKIHGPQGVGALLLRPNVRPRPLICGGDQQEGIRPGTLNLPGIVGFATAIRLLGQQRNEGIPKMRELTDRLIRELTSRMEGLRAIGDPECRAPGIAVLAVEKVESEVLLHALEMRGVLAASSSACHSSRVEPPRGLEDAGLKKGEGAVRLSLTLDTNPQEIDRAIAAFVDAVDAVRSGRTGDL